MFCDFGPILILVFQLNFFVVTVAEIQKYAGCNWLHSVCDWLPPLETSKIIKQNAPVICYSLCVTSYIPSRFQKYQT